jgi:hypothetical protein
MVVRHCAGNQDVNLKAVSGLCEAVQERVVCFGVRTQQEHPLRAAARDEVKATWKDLAR